ncbi:MAG TPA: MlaD family protein [Syntrophales bacterium]|nr:MlaD family protein [Syntrophales bacterium]
MFSISSEAKVGLFVLVGFLILGYMSVQVGKGGLGLKKGYSVDVVFDSAAGLSRDASVQIAGVEVGRVESIKLKDGKALVALRITPDVMLEKDVAATIKTHGVLGDKYVEIIPGSKGQAFIEPGGHISLTERHADIDKLLSQVGLIADDIKVLTGSLSKVLAGEKGEQSISDIIENTRQLTHNINVLIKSNEESLHAVLENTRDLTDNLNKVVTKNDNRITELLDSLKGASQEMQKTFANLNDISDGMKKGEGTVGKLLNDSTTVDRLNKTLASLQEVTDKINQGKGTIGKLVNEEETVKNLNEGLAGINRYVNKAEQFRTFLSYRGEYLVDNSNMKSYLDLKMQPTPDKFYILGLASDPRGKRTIKDRTTAGVTTREEKWKLDDILFNVQIGKRFKDVVLKGGIFESTGGFGIDYMAMNDDLRLSFEAFDFADDRRAHFKTAAEYRFFKHLYLSAGWDDFASDQGNRSLFAGISIRFEDDDLKYLLTSTPIPK